MKNIAFYELIILTLNPMNENSVDFTTVCLTEID